MIRFYHRKGWYAPAIRPVLALYECTGLYLYIRTGQAAGTVQDLEVLTQEKRPTLRRGERHRP